MTYFKLHPTCVVVRGAKNALVCDLQRKSYKVIPASLIDVLDALVSKSILEVEQLFNKDDQVTFREYLQFLIDSDFGFLSSEANLNSFPGIEFTNSNVVDEYEISNAIIDVSINSSHDFENILKQLVSLGCKHIQIRCFDRLNTIELINAILLLAENSTLRSIEFLVKHDPEIPEESFVKFMIKYPRINQIIVHSSPRANVLKGPYNIGNVFFIEDEITSDKHCGIISPYYFSVGLTSFIAAKTGNSCLKGKVSVDVNGEIRNCPSMNETFGNIKSVTFEAALNSGQFSRIGRISKDQIDVCKDCEFRYICPDCRAFISEKDNELSKPAKCAYDPYTGHWSV